jgi:hypothetical protein
MFWVLFTEGISVDSDVPDSDSLAGSVTLMLRKLGTGDPDAVQLVFDTYFQRLASLIGCDK